MLKAAPFREFNSKRRSLRAPRARSGGPSGASQPSDSPSASPSFANGPDTGRATQSHIQGHGHGQHAQGHGQQHHTHGHHRPKWATTKRVHPLSQEERDAAEMAKTPGLLAPMRIHVQQQPHNPNSFKAFGSITTRFSPDIAYDLLGNFQEAPRVFKNIASCDVVPLDDGRFRVTQHVKWRFLFLSGTFATSLICTRDNERRSVTFKLAEPGFMKSFSGGWQIEDHPLPSPSSGFSISHISPKPSPPPAPAAAASAEAGGSFPNDGTRGSLIEIFQNIEPAMVPPKPLVQYVYGIMRASIRTVFHDLCVEADKVQKLEDKRRVNNMAREPRWQRS